MVRKYFVPNYLHRVTASAVALREFGAADSTFVRVTSGPLTVLIALSSAKAFAGQDLSYQAKFAIDPGWHVYSSPLPANYTPVSLVFNDPQVVGQSLELPRVEPTEIAI